MFGAWSQVSRSREDHDGVFRDFDSGGEFFGFDAVESSVPIPVETEPFISSVEDHAYASTAFYRLLGVSIDDTFPPEWAAWAEHHVNGTTSNGVRVEFDSVAFAKHWNPGLDASKLGTAVLPMFHVATRDEVDRVHARITAAGHRSHKHPEDAFWGARYAIVEDPDGNAVGITSVVPFCEVSSHGRLVGSHAV